MKQLRSENFLFLICHCPAPTALKNTAAASTLEAMFCLDGKAWPSVFGESSSLCSLPFPDQTEGVRACPPCPLFLTAHRTCWSEICHIPSSDMAAVQGCKPGCTPHQTASPWKNTCNRHLAFLLPIYRLALGSKETFCHLYGDEIGRSAKSLYDVDCKMTYEVLAGIKHEQQSSQLSLAKFDVIGSSNISLHELIALLHCCAGCRLTPRYGPPAHLLHTGHRTGISQHQNTGTCGPGTVLPGRPGSGNTAAPFDRPPQTCWCFCSGRSHRLPWL